MAKQSLPKKYDPEELVVHTVHTFKPENEETFKKLNRFPNFPFLSGRTFFFFFQLVSSEYLKRLICQFVYSQHYKNMITVKIEPHHEYAYHIGGGY